MSAIADKLRQIKNAVYGKDVRDAIHDSIQQCYEDATGNPDSVSKVVNDLNVTNARIDNITTLSAGSTTGDAELIDIRTGYDGTVYSSAGNAVRGQVQGLYSHISELDDIRVGADYKSYDTAGDAVRDQYKIVKDAIDLDYDEQFLTSEKKETGHYWYLSTDHIVKYTNDSMICFSPVVLKAGEYFWRLLPFSYIKNNETGEITQLDTDAGGTSLSATFDFDFTLYASASSASNGHYFSTIKISTVDVPDGRFNVKNGITNSLYGDYEEIAGSYNKTFEHAFKSTEQYLITLVESSSNTVQFLGVPDISNPGTKIYEFLLKVGESTLWTPKNDYEGLNWSVNGSYKVKIEYLNGIADTIPKIMYCGPHRDLNTLKKGIEEATKYMGTTLYVDAGVYDLIEEFGDEYFENLTSSDTMQGLQLKNRVHVIFSTNSKVISHYTGNNQYALSVFSPFNVGEYGFTIENLTLECSRCRYAVHDERNGATEQCISEYINCILSIDNSDNPNWSNSCCLGGGCGSNHIVKIKNCIFNGTTGAFVVNYHDSNKTSNPNHKAKIIIEGCYFERGNIAFQFSRQDASEDSIIEVRSNSLPYVSGFTEGVYLGSITNPKTKTYIWGNTVRQ